MAGKLGLCRPANRVSQRRPRFAVATERAHQSPRLRINSRDPKRPPARWARVGMPGLPTTHTQAPKASRLNPSTAKTIAEHAYSTRASGQFTNASMAEMPHTTEHHRHATLVGRSDHLVVAHGATGLDDTGGTCIDHHVQAVAEGEEGVAGDGRPGQ